MKRIRKNYENTNQNKYYVSNKVSLKHEALLDVLKDIFNGKILVF